MKEIFLFPAVKEKIIYSIHILCVKGYFSNWSSADRDFTRPNKVLLQMAHNDRSETALKTYS